jgi:hypothetical protein
VAGIEKSSPWFFPIFRSVGGESRQITGVYEFLPPAVTHRRRSGWNTKYAAPIPVYTRTNVVFVTRAETYTRLPREQKRTRGRNRKLRKPHAARALREREEINSFASDFFNRARVHALHCSTVSRMTPCVISVDQWRDQKGPGLLLEPCRVFLK